jgi:hypothetical protein
LLATGVAPRETLRITVLVAGAAVMAVMLVRLAAWNRPGAGTGERHEDRHAGAAFSAAVGYGPPAVRSWREVLAMATTLVAMAVCYFLAPEFAAWYAVVAVAWFVMLGVPAATTASGDHDALARCDLVKTCVGRPRLPGTTAHALAAILTHAAILGWPAVVAAVLWRGAAWTSGGPVLAILVVAIINIGHNFFVQVSERRREIGIMRAVGATEADVLLIVLGEAAMVGIVGGVIGIGRQPG